MLTLVLVSATAVAITWAATVQTQLNSLDNTFTTPDVAAQLAEDRWDSKDFGGTGEAPSANDTSISLPIVGGSTTGKGLGANIAKSYSTGTVIPKNPMIKNSSGNDVDEWVAMKVDYLIPVYDGSKYVAYEKVTGDVYVGMKTDGGETKYLQTDNTWSTETTNAKKITSYYKAISVDPSNTVTIGGKRYYSFPTKTDFEAALATLHSNVEGSTAVSYKDLETDYSATTETGKYTNDAGEWVASDSNGKTFYYSKAIKYTSSGNGTEDANYTKPLFNSVKIKSSFTTENAPILTFSGSDVVRDANGLIDTTEHTMVAIPKTSSGDDKLYYDGYPDFQINLKGYAVQAEGVVWKQDDSYPAKTALDALMTN